MLIAAIAKAGIQRHSEVNDRHSAKETHKQNKAPGLKAEEPKKDGQTLPV